MTTQVHHHDHHHASEKSIFGVWIYILTDFIMFAGLFATYAVIHNNTFGGPGIQQVTNLPHIMLETLVFLVSAFTCGLSIVGFQKANKCLVQFWLAISFLLGLGFLGLQYHHLAGLVCAGITWQGSAFLSAYFSLIAIFCAHLIAALLWALVLLIQFASQGLTEQMKTRLTCLGLFWSFLNMIWLLIFTLVYLTGAI